METPTIDKLINDYVELKASVKSFTEIMERQAAQAKASQPIFQAITGSAIFLDLKRQANEG